MAERRTDRTPLLDGERLATLRRRLTTADGLLLCLDFDGVLAPVVDDPDRAAVTPSNREALRRLASRPDVTVGIVSWRSLSELRERVPADGVHCAGNHGLEWDDGDGRTVTPAVRSRQPAMQRVIDELRDAVADLPRCTVRDGELTASVHFRRTPDERNADVVEAVGSVVVSMDDVRSRRGRGIIDVLPDVPVDRERTIERLRERHPEYVPVFVGDDRPHQDGFRAVTDDGFGVAVGDGSDATTTARVSDVDGVAMLLGWLLQTC